MRIYHAKDYADMSRKAANIVSAQVIMKPNCVLGLATGSHLSACISSSLSGPRRGFGLLRGYDGEP